MNPYSFHIEQLETRQMLSAVEIFAAGATGQENLDLFIDDQYITTFTSVGGDVDARSFERFVYETPETLQGSTIGIRFANDFYNPEQGVDANLLVDRIVVDGVNFETEAPTTRSTGIWRDGFTGPGQFETELFNINATFSFDIPQDTANRTITFDALGTTGDEIVELAINGVTVDSFTFEGANQQQTFSFETDDSVAIEDLEIRFVNDLFDPAAGVDRNVQIFEYRVTDNETGNVEVSNTSDSDVLSDGIFVDGVGITSGFGAGGFLSGNGSVQTIRFTGDGLNPEVDTSFGSNGLAASPEVFNTNIGIFLDNTPEAVGFGPSGEIALANGDSIALFDANGQPITSFGDQGVVELQPLLMDLTSTGSSGVIFGSTIGQQIYVNSVNFFADGSVLLSGAADTGTGRFMSGAVRSSPAVLKLNADGSVDTGFSGDGILDDSFFDLNSTQNEVASAIDDQGRTVLFGSIQQTPSFGGTPVEYAIARLNPDGTYDTSFGFEATGNAFLSSDRFNNATNSSRVLGVEFDSQGRAIAGVAGPTEVTLIRFNEDGSPDFSFGDQGLVVTSIENNVVTSFQLDSQDRVVFGQAGNFNNGFDSLVYRFLADGQPDVSFGVDGVLAVAPSPGTLTAQNAAESPTPNLRRLALDQDDNIVLAAEIQSADGTQSLGLLQRVTAGGQIDRDFGVGGSFVLPFEPLEPFRPSNTTFRLDSYEAGIAFDVSGDLIVTTVDGLRRVSFS